MKRQEQIVSAWQDGMPDGVWDLMDHYIATANEWLGPLAGRQLPRDRSWAARQLALPRVVDSTWLRPTAPVAVGSGWVHADLIEDDVKHFERLLDTTRPHPERLAAEAQRWRLPVTPYRQELSPARDEAVEPPPRQAHRSLRGMRVVDLTTLWAGPLATSLLANAGAEVWKLDPSVRRDGFYERPALYRELNRGKQVLDLDLRDSADRSHFEMLVASADLVIDSFSRRVLPNFGYSPQELRRIKPDVATISIVAFPADVEERDWLSYGGGIHAVSGLGMRTGAATPPPAAYPDPLSGMRAFTAALCLLATRGDRPHVEISLLGSVAPLVERALERWSVKSGAAQSP